MTRTRCWLAMAMLLLIDQGNNGYVIAQRSRTRARLSAWLRAGKLDRALANGACPDSTEELSLRARKLIAYQTRRELSRELHLVIRDAKQPRHHLDPVPICRRKVLLARALIEELADRVLNSSTVDARGLAQVSLLLREGSSPLYYRPSADDLEVALRAAITALEVRL